MNHSYVMGVTSSILTLKEQGFIIEKDGDNYMVSFDKDKSPIWEEFISKNLKLGFWNEYIQDGIVVFLFHLKDGIKRYEVHFYNNDEYYLYVRSYVDANLNNETRSLLYLYKS